MEKTVVLLFVTWCIILVSTLCRSQEVWRQGCPEGDFGSQTKGLMCGERPALLANVETEEGKWSQIQSHRWAKNGFGARMCYLIRRHRYYNGVWESGGGAF